MAASDEVGSVAATEGGVPEAGVGEGGAPDTPTATTSTNPCSSTSPATCSSTTTTPSDRGDYLF